MLCFKFQFVLFREKYTRLFGAIESAWSSHNMSMLQQSIMVLCCYSIIALSPIFSFSSLFYYVESLFSRGLDLLICLTKLFGCLCFCPNWTKHLLSIIKFALWWSFSSFSLAIPKLPIKLMPVTYHPLVQVPCRIIWLCYFMAYIMNKKLYQLYL